MTAALQHPGKWFPRTNTGRHHEAVAEQRPGEQPNPEQENTGHDVPGTELESPAGTPLDPEQLRQFQEFQQFQRFLQFQEAERTGPQSSSQQLQSPAGTSGELLAQDQQNLPSSSPSTLPARRQKALGWLEWLGKKILGWLIFFLLLAITLTWAYNHFLGDDDDNSTEAAAKQGGGKYHTREILSSEPYEAVRQVYDAIAQEDPAEKEPLISDACGRFDQEAQDLFARNTGHSDCRRAVLDLHEEVQHVTEYAESIRPQYYDSGAETLRIDSCDFEIRGGPALGVFTVQRVERGQWLITDHESGPRTCPESSRTSQSAEPNGP